MLINQVKLKHSKGTKVEIENPIKYSVIRTFNLWRGTIDVPHVSVIGVDPGINFGLTGIDRGEVFCVSGYVEKHEHQMERAYCIAYSMHDILRAVEFRGSIDTITAVEGAAHGKHFRQVQLAEVRMGFYMGLREIGRELPRVIPPMTARKWATGSGKDPVYLKYPLMNPNAADSLGVAIAALEKPPD